MDRMEKTRIDDIEALRGIAVIFTILQHIPLLLPWGSTALSLANRYVTLWSGVDLFFAISGFVIARDILNKLDSANGCEQFWRVAFAFWIKRIFRIWPTSWLWIIIPMVWGIIFSKSGDLFSFRENLADFVAIVMQVQNFHVWLCNAKNLTDQCGIGGTWWSLSLEEQFYIALPLAAFVFRKRLSYFLSAAVLLQLFLPRPTWSLLWAVRTDAIALGALLAIFSQRSLWRLLEPTFMTRPRYRLPTVALLIFLLASLPYSDEKVNIVPFSTGLVAIVSVIFVFIASFNGDYIVRNRAAKSIMLWIGSRSYSLYLIHWPAMRLTHALWWAVEPTGTVFGSNYSIRYLTVWFAITFACSELNYRFIEQPMRKKGRDIAARLQFPAREIAARKATAVV